MTSLPCRLALSMTDCGLSHISLTAGNSRDNACLSVDEMEIYVR